MPKFAEQLETIYASDRQTWRQWLQENHQRLPGVWLIYYKVKSGKPSVKYSEAVQEALCFGWIDSKVQSLDSERYQQIFTPRKPKSVWSKLNKQYVAELIEQGLMTQAGMTKILNAQSDGSWITLDDIEALKIPEDLQSALAVNAEARENFQKFSNSSKKNILFWIDSAKRIDTRLKRIEQTVFSAVMNQSPLQR
ncbi:YdeI/OmpD-associated family protein [Calothrix sp. 336/3]|uniref:YdeI/OmpD-associated family protein n=1 Tax=Calothrix sp. 336/3 TaxID=1337936 RepID=UPI0004E46A08|nr:YdeI/OmpD-associated family protein [Calothrix sp. 336/3]AKG23482.1 hypothetical protein IJ00_21340 [Calothrix sp. 336/3]